jgi:hypothetical protein
MLQWSFTGGSDKCFAISLKKIAKSQFWKCPFCFPSDGAENLNCTVTTAVQLCRSKINKKIFLIPKESTE